MSDRNNVIVHYHLFKNAGTSIDHLLKKNFKDRWLSFDGENPGTIISTAELERTITGNQDKVAFSSHQIVPPLPMQADCDIYPIVFLRDPIDRIKSAYLFEWKKQLGLDQAKGSLREYIERNFTHRRKSSIEEFQTIRLANINKNSFVGENVTDEDMLANACEFISNLKFVGIVDQFDHSVALLGNYLSGAFPEFEATPLKANVLQDLSLGQAEKRLAIRQEIGDELYEMIVDRNQMDEKLYQHGIHCFNRLNDHNVMQKAS